MERRKFTDVLGVDWDVWEVYPRLLAHAECVSDASAGGARIIDGQTEVWSRSVDPGLPHRLRDTELLPRTRNANADVQTA